MKKKGNIQLIDAKQLIKTLLVLLIVSITLGTVNTNPQLISTAGNYEKVALDEVKKDLKLEVTPIRGGVILNSDDTVYEGEYIKYNIKVSNTTDEEMKNVKVVATIPDGLTSAELKSNFNEVRQPYYYELKEAIAKTTINVGNLEAGESKEGYFEVKVDALGEQETKVVETSISSYVGTELIETKNITNKIEPAEVNLFMGSFIEYGGIHYGINVKSETQEEVEVKIHFPKCFSLKSISKQESDVEEFDKIESIYGGGIVIYLSDDFNGGNTLNNIDVETSENNVVTVKLQANKNYMFFGLINGTLIERDPNSTEETILAYAQTSDGKYMSNENRIKYLLQAVEVTMSSPNENDKLKFEDDIEYEITVNNIGGSRVESVADNDYVKVTLTDFLPENIKATEVIYDNWEEIFEEQVNGDNETISILKELNKVQKTEDISKTKTDNDGNKLPNISLELNIPKGEKAIIKIKAKAGMVYEETQIENMAKVVGDEIVETVSNKVSHIIHAYNYVESTQPDTPDTPENPDTPSNPGEPVKPGVTDPSNNGGGTINNNNQTEINASKNCDFKIDKYVSKITVTTINGTTAKDYNNEKLAKVEIRSKEINGSTVIIEYKLLIENIGGVAATLDGVKDYLPEGLTFSSQLNKNWAQNSDGSIFYAGNSKYIMQPGENIELTLIATKQMKSNTTGIFTNKAELGTVVGTGNKKDADMSNNSSEAQVIIGISTGAYTYITFVTIVLGILVIGAIILYKKGKINTKKIKKATFMLVFIITLLSTQVVQLGETEYKARDPKDFNSPLMGYYWEKSFEFQSPWNGDINDPTIYYYWYKGPTGYALCANDKIVMTMEGCSAYPVFTYNFAGHNYLGRTPRSYIGTDGILSLSKANEDSIPAIYNDGNIIYGPFAYNSENAERFSISILDNNGKRIDNWSLLDENKNGIGFDGLKNGQNKMFYLKFNAKLCENGISSIKLYANGTETRKYKRKDKYEAYYTNGDYQPIYVPELWTDEYEEKEYIKVNKEIEWTVFNGNIQILKKDPDSGKLLEGVGFKIKNSEGKWIIAVDENGTQKTVIGSVQLTELKYTDNKEEATEFITDSTGYVKIYNVIVGEYIIEEVSIGDNVFYGVDEKYISWDDGNGNTGNGNGAIITPANQTSYDYEGTGKNTMTIFNKQKYVDISGIVWEDIISGKDSTRNSLYKNDEYDVNDKEVANVTVRLLDSKGNEVQQSVLTDENGKYSFKKLEIDKLKEYYVQFTYNGMSYESVITNIEAENGSKANEGSERKTFNDKFDKIENNIAISVNSETTKLKYEKDEYISTLLYEGDNDVYGYDGAKFPINFTAEKYLITSNTYDGCGGYLDKIKSPETIRKEGITEVTGINQGIYEREQPDLFVTNDIMNTKISIKGYEHIYQYANRFNHRNEIVSDASVEGVGVKFGNKYTQTYLQPIYRADINYESEKNDEFKLYLTYVAALTNQSTTLTSKVNSIVNYYDTDYEVIAVGTEINEKGEISNELSYKKGSDVNGYRSINISTNLEIEAQGEKYVYVTFELPKEKISEIIKDEFTFSSITEITSYSTSKDGKVYAGIDKNSNPGNAIPGKEKETYENDTDKAPDIRLAVATERTTKGTVFFDSTSGELRAGEERIGNGIFDNGEQTIDGVKVLLKEGGKTVAETITDNGGNYNFNGYTPGKYTIEFVWGNETKTSDDTKINVYDYKGTIYEKTRLDNEGETWHKIDVETRKNDAMDNYDARSNIDTLTNELTYNTMSNLDYNKEMISTTPVMDVRIENLNNDISNLDNLLNEDGTIKMKYEISNVDFGIVERPRQDIKLEKRVTKISMVLQNGQILIDATVNEDGTLVGTTTGIKGPTPKPAVRQSNNSISGLITAEIDSELIHGSTLELEYEIVVKNIGELDYTTEEYYKYGVIDDSDAIVKISPTEIVDYMDNTVVFAENEEINKQSSTWEQQDEEAYKVNVSSTVYLTNGSEYKNKKILLTKYYQENNIQLKPGEVSNVLKLKTKKLLSARNDILVNNETEVIKLNKTGGRTVISTPGNYIPGMAYEEGGVNENDDDMAETFTITPPTGAYKNLIVPVATMVIAITILGVGIVIIKKKIL